MSQVPNQIVASLLPRDETRMLEFKRLRGAELTKMLRSITGFANTAGGLLVLGMEDFARALEPRHGSAYFMSHHLQRRFANAPDRPLHLQVKQPLTTCPYCTLLTFGLGGRQPRRRHSFCRGELKTNGCLIINTN